MAQTPDRDRLRGIADEIFRAQKEVMTAHDWDELRDATLTLAMACRSAVTSLADTVGVTQPVCKYCGNPVDKEGHVHAGGCGNVG